MAYLGVFLWVNRKPWAHPKSSRKNATWDILDKGERPCQTKEPLFRNAVFGISQPKDQPALTAHGMKEGAAPLSAFP